MKKGELDKRGANDEYCTLLLELHEACDNDGLSFQDELGWCVRLWLRERLFRVGQDWIDPTQREIGRGAHDGTGIGAGIYRRIVAMAETNGSATASFPKARPLGPSPATNERTNERTNVATPGVTIAQGNGWTAKTGIPPGGIVKFRGRSGKGPSEQDIAALQVGAYIEIKAGAAKLSSVKARAAKVRKSKGLDVSAWEIEDGTIFVYRAA